MKTSKLLIALLLCALLSASWSPALAARPSSSPPLTNSYITNGPKGTTILYVNNPTKSPMVIYLTGSQSITISAPPGHSKYYIPNGVYTYRYTVCGIPFKGTLFLYGGWRGLGWAKCVYVNQLVKNLTGGSLQIRLDGVRSRDRHFKDVPFDSLHYVFNISSKESRIKVVKGLYRFTVTGCGQTKSGKVNLAGNMQAWTWECKDGKLTYSTQGKR